MNRLLFVTTGLGNGGAERMLLKLLASMDRDRYRPAVVALTGTCPLADEVRQLGVPVHRLRRPFTHLTGAFELVQLIRKLRPALVQGWMYHGCLAAQLAAGVSGTHPNMLWGIRQAVAPPGVDRLTTQLCARSLAGLSRLPRAIVYNSRRAAMEHQALGYCAARTIIIPNGFDLAGFGPRPEVRTAMRSALGVPAEALVVGHVGRYHAAKDHEALLRAAGLLLQRRPDAHFLLAGLGVDPNNRALRGLIATLGIARNVHLLGERRDLPPLYAAFDIAVSSSRLEGFPNAIGEAMCCGVPCVVTDVGDSGYLIGDTGRVVPVGDPPMMMAAWDALLGLGAMERSRLGEMARSRIEELFSMPTVMRQYDLLYRLYLSSEDAA